MNWNLVPYCVKHKQRLGTRFGAQPVFKNSMLCTVGVAKDLLYSLQLMSEPIVSWTKAQPVAVPTCFWWWCKVKRGYYFLKSIYRSDSFIYLTPSFICRPSDFTLCRKILLLNPRLLQILPWQSELPGHFTHLRQGYISSIWHVGLSSSTIGILNGLFSLTLGYISSTLHVIISSSTEGFIL